MFKYWLILTLGGLCEAGWAYCLGRSKESGNWSWIMGFAFLYILSAVCLAIASKKIPVGTAYAIWTGIGATVTILMGIFILGEPANTLRIIFLSMIFIAVIGLEIIS